MAAAASRSTGLEGESLTVTGSLNKNFIVFNKQEFDKTCLLAQNVLIMPEGELEAESLLVVCDNFISLGHITVGIFVVKASENISLGFEGTLKKLNTMMKFNQEEYTQVIEKLDTN